MEPRILVLYECVNDKHVANLAASHLRTLMQQARISRRHVGGKTRALARLLQGISRGNTDIVVAIVDHDPGQPLPRSIQDLADMKLASSNVYYRVEKRDKRVAIVIALSPELEEWLLKVCGKKLGKVKPIQLKYYRSLFRRVWETCREAHSELKQALEKAISEIRGES